ncbi:hypothetical protein EDB84DRAFT_1525440, partial [Lactarius hengduanensis]
MTRGSRLVRLVAVMVGVTLKIQPFSSFLITPIPSHQKQSAFPSITFVTLSTTTHQAYPSNEVRIQLFSLRMSVWLRTRKR